MPTSYMVRRAAEASLTLALLIILAAPMRADAAVFILSGGASQSDWWSADDQMVVVLGSTVIENDGNNASNRPPFGFVANDGDTLFFQFIDTVGGCRGHSAIWLHDTENACGQLIVPAREDGCAGYPPNTMYDAPAVTVHRIECPASLTVTAAGPAQMQIPQSSGVTAVQLDPPAATLYGKTELPFQVLVLHADSGQPWAGAKVSLATDSPGSSIAGATTLDAFADGNGIVLSTLVVDNAYAGGGSPATVHVTAKKSSAEAAAEWSVIDNLKAVEGLTVTRLPAGKTIPGLERFTAAPFAAAHANELREQSSTMPTCSMLGVTTATAELPADRRVRGGRRRDARPADHNARRGARLLPAQH